jgi:hypothetical protein
MPVMPLLLLKSPNSRDSVNLQSSVQSNTSSRQACSVRQ